MAKKIDIKRTLGSPTPSFNVDAIEEMTRMIHTKKVGEGSDAQKVTDTKQAVAEEPVLTAREIELKKEAKAAPKTAKKTLTKAVEPKEVVAAPTKRGRKPNPPASDERMVRISVDLPESVFIKLKVKVIQEKTDMKTWAWRLIERELS
jgi:hypothetical protein